MNCSRVFTMVGCLLTGPLVVAGEADAPSPPPQIDPQEQVPKVAEIVVQFLGPLRIDQARILHFVQLKVGAPLTLDAKKEIDRSRFKVDLEAMLKAQVVSQAEVRIEALDPNRFRIIFVVRVERMVGSVRTVGLEAWRHPTIPKDLLQIHEGSRVHLDQDGAGQAGRPFIHDLLEADRLTLEQFLRKENYAQAQVRAEYQVRADQMVDVTFTVDPGEPLQVGRVRFVCVPAGTLARERNPDQQAAAPAAQVPPHAVVEDLPPGVYRRPLLDPRRSELLNLPAQTFAPELVEGDRGAVQRFFANRGYLDAQVEVEVGLMDLVNPSEERRTAGPILVPDGQRHNRAVITYRIEPGPRYYLGSVEFLGFKSGTPEELQAKTRTSSEELRTAFALAQGTPFDEDEIKRAIHRAERVFRNMGYARAFFDSQPSRWVYRVENGVRYVDLKLLMKHWVSVETLNKALDGEGARYRVGRMTITGNAVTKDRVVRRALRLAPGDQWSDTASERSVREMERIGLFRSAPIPPSLTPDFIGERPVGPSTPGVEPEFKEADVEVKVEETKTGHFQVSLGYGERMGLMGTLSFEENNFDLLGTLSGESLRGAGQSLNASTSVSKQRKSISTAWREPHLDDGPYSLSVKAYRNDASDIDWDELRIGGSVTFGRYFFDDRLNVGLGYGLTWLDITDPDPEASNDALDGAQEYLNHSVLFNQTWNDLNRSRFPTSGWRVKLGENLTFGDAEYWDLNFDVDVFVPLFRNDLGGTTFVRLSHMDRLLEGYGSDPEVPFYDRIFGGGSSPRHRGYDSYREGPRETNRNGYRAMLGGNFETLTTLELSVPIPPSTADDSFLRGVVFLDVGQVWRRPSDAAWDQLGWAPGVGIRFPQQLPFAIDYAWLFNHDGVLQDRQFHIALAGLSF